MVATCKHTALLGRYSRCIQEATLNTTNSWARGGNREHGAGDPRKASRACPDQAICLQGLRGQQREDGMKSVMTGSWEEPATWVSMGYEGPEER